MVLEEDHPQYGRVRTLGSPIKLSDTPPMMRRPPHAFGEHTDAILRELDFDSQTIAAWRSAGVI
jgi:crotonobetainyl-CoA:carnitine CoA-transferase CaiB-like acyl-CoA transferase